MRFWAAAGLAASLAFQGSAKADDIALPDAPDLNDIAFFEAGESGLYVRADAGFGSLTADGALRPAGRLNPVLGGPAIMGLGLGYRAGILRTDITAEYRTRAKVESVDGLRSHMDGAIVLANLYADIGTWYGVTPYVGVGVGAGWQRLSGYDAFAPAYRLSSTRTSFAWAVQGGFAIHLADDLKLDLNYRYLDIAAPHATTFKLKQPASHDIRIGLRWALP